MQLADTLSQNPKGQKPSCKQVNERIEGMMSVATAMKGQLQCHCIGKKTNASVVDIVNTLDTNVNVLSARACGHGPFCCMCIVNAWNHGQGACPKCRMPMDPGLGRNHNQLTHEHYMDWDLWLMIGPDQDSVMAAMRYLGIYVRWTSVYYSTSGASVPICHDCRVMTYSHRVSRIENQSDCGQIRPPLQEV
jgi:hypothetical protein